MTNVQSDDMTVYFIFLLVATVHRHIAQAGDLSAVLCFCGNNCEQRTSADDFRAFVDYENELTPFVPSW